MFLGDGEKGISYTIKRAVVLNWGTIYRKGINNKGFLWFKDSEVKC
jgi:hypothetical protein